MFDWPDDLPLPFDGAFAPFVRSLSGGQSLSGFEQVQPQLHDRWSAQFSFHLGTDDRVLAARALLFALRGRANTVLLPAFDAGRAPYSESTTLPAGADLGDAFTDPPFWKRWPQQAGRAYEFSAVAGLTGVATIIADDTIGFAATSGVPKAGQFVTLLGVRRELLSVTGDGPYVLRIRPPIAIAGAATVTKGNLVTAVTNAAASLNATSLDVKITVGAAPKPGHVFSVGSRLYGIELGGVQALGSGVYRLTIWPWLRFAVAEGEAVNFVSPACEMRLASDEEGAEALRSLRLGKWGDITLRFDEASAT